MLSKLTIILSSLVLAVSAHDQCNTGSLTCCNSLQASDSPAALAAFQAVGIAVQSVTGQVGLTCSAPTVIGVSGNSCSNQPVCCTNNNFNGVVALGCTPVNANLSRDRVLTRYALF